MSRTQNWSGSVRFQPREIVSPDSEAAVSNLVNKVASRDGTLRVVGAGHSFTPLVATEDTLVSLDNWQGIEAFDAVNQTARVRAGTRLFSLGEMLHANGVGMENLGDINRQSIAGAVSTGTHGTGIAFGNIPTQVTAMRIVGADGAVLECSETHQRELYHAARVSLGALGIITEATLRLRKAYKLEYKASKGKFEELLPQVEDLKRKNRNFEFYWFPYSETVQIKESNETELPAREPGLGGWFNDIFLENGVFWVLSKKSRYLPFLSRTAAKISAWGVGSAHKVNWSHRVYATPRLVRFQEMEYCMPADAFESALRAVKREVEKQKFRVHFPLECRWSKGDDAWLSPAHGRDSAYIAVHMYKGMPHEAYFKAMEKIFRDHGGRPHWGKMHFLSAKELKALYPKWDDFQNLRQQLDPKGIFMNGHLRRIFCD